MDCGAQLMCIVRFCHPRTHAATHIGSENGFLSEAEAADFRSAYTSLAPSRGSVEKTA
jgi:hypothetical protein